MTETEKTEEWLRFYKASLLKFGALRSVLKNDPKLLPEILKRLGLRTAEDVVRNCDDGR